MIDVNQFAIVSVGVFLRFGVGAFFLAKYKQFKTIWEHTFENYLTDSSSSSLKSWSSKQGVGTSYNCSVFFVCQLTLPFNALFRMSFHIAVKHACALCQDQTGALHMFCDTKESESCLVKALAKHASESVLVVRELLCTGVQANTERHTRKETRERCSCWGYKQQSHDHATVFA